MPLFLCSLPSLLYVYVEDYLNTLATTIWFKNVPADVVSMMDLKFNNNNNNLWALHSVMNLGLCFTVS
jgi:hypothetical protein